MAGITKNIWILIGVLVVVAIALAWAFGSGNGTAVPLSTEQTTAGQQSASSQTSPTQATTQKTGANTAGTVTGRIGTMITYTSKGFSPAYLEIKVGKVITFINKSSGAMRVISTQVPLIDGLPNPGFDEGNPVGLNGTYTFNLSAPGEWHYKSFYRPDFTGVIVVTSQ